MSMEESKGNIRKGIVELGKGGDNTATMLEIYQKKRANMARARELFDEAVRLLIGPIEGTLEDEELMLHTTAATAEMGASDGLEAFKAAGLGDISNDDAQAAMRIATDAYSRIGYQVRPMNNSYLSIRAQLATAITATNDLMTSMETHVDGTIRAWEPIPPLVKDSVQYADSYLKDLGSGTSN